MPLSPAIFGISNGTLNTVVELVLLVIVVVGLALVWCTYADARRRIDDGMLVASATLSAVVFPFVGTVVYIIVRPPEFLEDIRERELEMQAAEARLHSLDYQLCPHCDHPAGRDFLRCPHCLRKLRDTCGTCTKPLDPDWMICPYCEAEIPGITPQRRSRRRSRGEDVAFGDEGEATGYEDTEIGEAFDAGTEPAIEAGYGDGPQDAYDEALESEAPPSTQH
jgi:hypothetical protein